jgi:protocatechuate 3,4-dioxygenase beta subunit
MSRTIRRAVPGVLLTTAVIGAGLVLPTPGNSDEVSAAGSGTVSGFVFQDYNSNGVFDSTVAPGQATDLPLAGIEVRVFDADGVEVGSTVSGASGSYSITVSGAASDDVRVEFATPSTGPLSGLEPSFDGAEGGTTVQFVTLPATDVDLAMNYPGEYCQSSPNIATSRLCAGTGNATAPTVLVTRYDGGPYTSANGFDNLYSSWTAARAGTKANTGSILGMAWDPTSRRIYNSAYIRRQAEMYEAGGKPLPGAIFVTNPNGTSAAEGVGGTTSFLVDLETLMDGDQFSNSNPAGPGFIPTNAARKLQFAIDGTIDGGADNDGVDSDLVSGQVGVHEEVGKASIGDIEIVAGTQSDGSGTLYVVSLYTKHLYAVPLAANGATPTTMSSLGDITNGVSCTNGEGRPFSVKHWRGSLYLGVVCDGSGDFNPANPGATTDTNLSFTIRKYDLETSTWSNFFGPHPLNASGNIGKGQADGTSSSLTTSTKWNAWTDFWPTTNEYPQIFGTRPVPMLSSIEFDNDGSMILGFRDRAGDQNGLNEQETPSGRSHFYPTLASGDIYRVCRVGPGFTGADYAFEGNSPDCAQQTNAANGTEYYIGDKYFTFHYEVSVGMAEQVPGFPEVLVNMYDPYDGNGTGATFYSGGTRYIRNATGDIDGVFPNAGGGTIFFAWSGNSNNPNKEGGFLKTNGMSDVEALCDGAPLQIGNRVWIDENENGVQDPGETPVVGATVRLYDSEDVLVGTAITDEEGQYLFASNVTEPANGGANPDEIGGGLSPFEKHTIRLDEPSDYVGDGPLTGYTLTTTDAEPGDVATTSSDMIDNDGVPEGDGTVIGFSLYPAIHVDELRAGENNHTFDFGFVPLPLVGMGDFTWFDSNENGVQDPDEPVVPGVLVELLDVNGDPILDSGGDPITATTDENGYYFIDGLTPGDYRVRFTPPDGYTFTISSSSAGTSENDSNPVRSTGVTPVFTIDAAVLGDTVADTDDETLAEFVNPTIDAGFVPVVGFGNYTWIDLNQDGIQGVDEPPLAGVLVEALDADGEPVLDADGDPRTATTDDEGYYFIDDLAPGDYQARFTIPDGYVFTEQSSAGSTSANDSNPDTETGVTPVFTIASAPAGDTETDIDDGTVAQLANPTIDAGVVPLVAMGDYTWYDLNEDGRQDDDEPVLPGVTVTLHQVDDAAPVYDVDGNLATAVTDVNGYYFIDALLPGSYIAKFELPEGLDGWAFTQQTAGDDSEVDSNPDRVTGITPVFDIAPEVDGETVVDDDVSTRAIFVNPTIDAGIVPLVAGGGYVWVDLDRDGVRGDDESPLPGVEVHLFDADGNPATYPDGSPVPSVFTDENGFYVFDGLLPGTYTAKFVAPSGYAPTVTGDGGADDSNIDAAGVTAVFELTGRDIDDIRPVFGEDGVSSALFINPTIGAGYVPLVAVGDYTWVDLDRDGLQGDDEPPLPGVEVHLFDADGNPATYPDGSLVPSVFTDENGFYVFDGLLPGSYTAKFVAPDGYIATVTGDGGADDSNIDAEGFTDVFELVADEVGDMRPVDEGDDVSSALFIDPTIDAGYVGLVAVGDYVWIDADRDGQQGASELPLAGVQVVLELPDGTPATDYLGDAAFATTDRNGYYFIDGLLPGEYVARFELPSGYVFTVARAGANPRIDSNPEASASDPLVGRTRAFVLRSSVRGNMVADVDPQTIAVFVDPTIDAGVVPIPPDAGPTIPVTGFAGGVILLLGVLLPALGVVLVLRNRRRIVA